MKKKETHFPDLSPAELDILRKLWSFGRATIREVHDALQAQHSRSYSTTKTIMDRMVQKGLLSRGAFHGVFLYQARISRPQGLAQMVRHFATRVLEAPPDTVLPLFAKAGNLTEEELDELEALLKEGEEG